MIPLYFVIFTRLSIYRHTIQLYQTCNIRNIRNFPDFYTEEL